MTTLWKNPSTGKLLKLPGGDLMGDDAGCCCGGESLADCSEVYTYLLTVATKTLSQVDDFTPVDACTGCPSGMSGTGSSPTNTGSGVRWNNASIGSYTACGDSLSWSVEITYVCTSTSLQITAKFQSEVSLPGDNDCGSVKAYSPTYEETFPFPGGSLPVDSDWLDQEFELTCNATTELDCGCDFAGVTATVA